MAARTFIAQPDVRPARRARSTACGIASIAAATSAAVDVCPSENRSEPRAAASLAPMAMRTCEGCATPAAHAEPVEHSMPRASSSMSSESPSQPGKLRCAMPGSRSVGCPLTITSGMTARTPAISSSRSAASRAVVSSRRDTVTAVAVASPIEPTTSRVPERTSRSWPPPCSDGVQSTSRRSSSAPVPTGPPSLCPVIVSAATPDVGEVHRQRRHGLHRIGVERARRSAALRRRVRRSAAPCRPRCWPTSR